MISLGFIVLQHQDRVNAYAFDHSNQKAAGERGSLHVVFWPQRLTEELEKRSIETSVDKSHG